MIISRRILSFLVCFFGNKFYSVCSKKLSSRFVSVCCALGFLWKPIDRLIFFVNRENLFEVRMGWGNVGIHWNDFNLSRGSFSCLAATVARTVVWSRNTRWWSSSSKHMCIGQWSSALISSHTIAIVKFAIRNEGSAGKLSVKLFNSHYTATVLVPQSRSERRLSHSYEYGLCFVRLF